jgi:HAD superfamily hydrolase (TIGR01509 family)
MHFELVIFDCDGVLVDSEPISCRMFTSMLNQIGIPFSYDDTYREFTGLSDDSTKKLLEKLVGYCPPESFFDEVTRKTNEALAAEVQAFEGIKEVIQNLSIKFCVASSGTPEKISTSLNKAGLIDHFTGRIFSATQVQHGKPNPDLFLHAAQVMGVPPSKCAVVEDSIPGVQAGIAAGMTVFGFAPHDQGLALKDNGATVFHAMSDFPGVLECNGGCS